MQVNPRCCCAWEREGCDSSYISNAIYRISINLPYDICMRYVSLLSRGRSTSTVVVNLVSLITQHLDIVVQRCDLRLAKPDLSRCSVVIVHLLAMNRSIGFQLLSRPVLLHVQFFSTQNFPSSLFTLFRDVS